MLEAAARQVFSTPKAQVENVRFERVAIGTINLYYDLVADDATAVFEITLEVSNDGGATFEIKPKSVSGDVGPGITPGLSKRAIWNAPADGYADLKVDQFRFRVLTRAGRAMPSGAGGLNIDSDPPGAAVTVDGKSAGKTPVKLSDLAVGAHTVKLQLIGFTEETRTISVVAGQVTSIEARLTPTTASTPTTATPTPPTQTGTASQKKGGVNPLVWVGLAGAGAAGAAFALKGGDKPIPTKLPVAGSITLNHPSSVGLLDATSYSLKHEGWSGTDATCKWSATGTPLPANAQNLPTTCGASVENLVFQGSTTYTFKVDVTNAGGTTTASTTLTIKDVTGTWTGTLTDGTSTFSLTLNLQQVPGRISGDYTDGRGRHGTVFRYGVSDEKNVSLIIDDTSAQTINLSGRVDNDFATINGTVEGRYAGSFSVRRQ